jgi:DNA-binding NarL/FixJ family response regulator
MTIQVHVACDDEAYRAVIADFLDHQTDMEVVGASAGGGMGAAAARLAGPDVVVLGIPPNGDVARSAPSYRGMMREGAAIVAFCTTPEQAVEYQEVGIERVIFSDDPARMLTAAVRAAYTETSGTFARAAH